VCCGCFEAGRRGCNGHGHAVLVRWHGGSGAVRARAARHGCSEEDGVVTGARLGHGHEASSSGGGMVAQETPKSAQVVARLGQRHGYMVALDVTDKERRKSSKPVRFLLTGRSGGNDRILPSRVRSTPERSKTSRVVTGRV